LLFNSVFKDTTRYFRRLIAAASAASDEPA
jgi:hypothetical protein